MTHSLTPSICDIFLCFASLTLISNGLTILVVFYVDGIQAANFSFAQYQSKVLGCSTHFLNKSDQHVLYTICSLTRLLYLVEYQICQICNSDGQLLFRKLILVTIVPTGIHFVIIFVMPIGLRFLKFLLRIVPHVILLLILFSFTEIPDYNFSFVRTCLFFCYCTF